MQTRYIFIVLTLSVYGFQLVPPLHPDSILFYLSQHFLTTEYVPWLWVPFHLLQEVLQHCAIYRNLKELWSVRAATLAYQPMVQELCELSSKRKIWTCQHCLSCRPVELFEWHACRIICIVNTINGTELIQIIFYKKYETGFILSKFLMGRNYSFVSGFCQLLVSIKQGMPQQSNYNFWRVAPSIRTSWQSLRRHAAVARSV
jgi:hypothetical protein